MFIRHANVKNIDLKVPLFERGGISEDLKSILITVIHYISIFVHLPAHLQTYVYRSLESTSSHL